MKTLIAALLISTALQFAVSAQRPGLPYGHPIHVSAPQGAPAEELPKFDIDFPGGPPSHLVEHIQMGLALLDKNNHFNVIIPEEFKDEKLPPLKMRNVDAHQLFKALELASYRNVGNAGAIDPQTGLLIGSATVRYAFQTDGPITPRSIWYFHVEKPIQVETRKVVRYFQLAPYFPEFTMDDIGSAIEAGWDMLGEKDTPKLKFHQDTKLLIAVGAPQHLEMIDAMLKELGAGMTNLPFTNNDEPAPKKAPPAQPQPATKNF